MAAAISTGPVTATTRPTLASVARGTLSPHRATLHAQAAVPATATSVGASPAAAVPAAPTDFTLFKNASLAATIPTASRDLRDGPSVANDGQIVFLTGNRFAALSQDGGGSFSYIDPASSFPVAAGGFCCRQRVLYEPSRDIFVWVLEYAAALDGSNVVRLAVARGAAGAVANSWTYYDVPAGQFGGAYAGDMLDLPQVAVSSNDLYLTADILTPPGNARAATGVLRLQLDQLRAAGSLNFLAGSITAANGLTPAAGASTTMYFVGQSSASPSTALILFTWSESADITAATTSTVNHSASPTGAAACPGPDARDWCGSDDARVKTAWVAGGSVTALWDAPQGTGGLGTFAFPYVQGAQFDPGTLAIASEPLISSTSFAYAYPSVAVNSAAHLGLTIAFGGGSVYPSTAVGIEDDVHPSGFEFAPLVTGTSGPSTDTWGDYLAVAPDSATGTTWVAAGYALVGGGGAANVDPHFGWFGRARDNPLPASPYTSYFGYYDNVSTGVLADNIHVVNPSTATASGTLKVGSQSVPFSLAGGQEGYYRFASGTVGGPVTISSSLRVIASQRVQFNQSFNETPALPASAAAAKLYFPWYDRISSPGFSADDIVVFNPGGASATATVHIPGCGDQSQPLVAGGQAIFTCANGFGGPVVITGSAALLATQRVVYYGAFNEVTAQSAADAAKSLIFTWFDRASSPGFLNDNIHVVNPGPVPANVTVTIPNGPTPCVTGTSSTAPLAANGGEAYYSCPGGFGGPVTVLSDQPIIASQRVQYYQSFNEVSALAVARAATALSMPWFDRVSSPGFQSDNVHVVNPQSVNAHLVVTIPGCSQVSTTLPGGFSEVYFTCAGGFGGPVTVLSDVPVLASQRVLYYSTFNEAAATP